MEKLVVDYTRLNILQVYELDFLTFLIYAHDAYIFKMMQTEEGRENLEEAWYMQQTEIDIESLRQVTNYTGNQ